MPPLDPNIALQLRPVQVPQVAQDTNPQQRALSLAQLAGLVQQQRLQGLLIQEEQEQAQGRRALRELYAQNPTLDTPEQRSAFQRQVSAVNPEAGFQLANQFRQLDLGGAKIQHEEAQTRKTLAETEKVRDERAKLLLELGTKRIEVTDKVLSATTPESYASDRQFLMQTLGLPDGALPSQYHPQAIEQARRRALGEKDRAELLFKQQQEQRVASGEQARIGIDRQRVGLEEFRVANETRRVDLEALRQRATDNRVDYGLGTDLDAIVYSKFGGQLGPRGVPSPEQVEQARLLLLQQRTSVSSAQGAEAARITANAKPLDDTVARQVSDLDTTLKFVGDIRTLFKPEYVGPITGRVASLRQSTTGGLPPEQVDFNRVVDNLKESLLRAHSGAAVTDREYERLTALVPGANLPADTFRARLDSFERALRQTRESKLAVATTGRGDLPRPTVPFVSGGGNAEALIDATFSDPRNRGTDGKPRRSREQITKDVQLYLSKQR